MKREKGETDQFNKLRLTADDKIKLTVIQVQDVNPEKRIEHTS